jgi:spermidine synthase
MPATTVARSILLRPVRLSYFMPTAEESVIKPVPASSASANGTVLAAGIALSSFSALLLELALTRLFSVVLFYHFAFLAISIALLGLGAGGVFAHLRKQRLQRYELQTFAAACCCWNAIAIPIVLEIVLHVPVSLQFTGGNFLRLTVVYLASAVPFFLTGLQFSVVFARESARIPRLYGADLVGGSLACLAIVPLLNWIGGPSAIFFSALMSALAAVIWSSTRKTRNIGAVLFALLVCVIAVNHSGRLADITWAKGMRRNNVEFARWNALSRVEVDRARDGARVIVIDADANTYIMNADPQHFGSTEWQKQLMSAPPATVNVLRPHGAYAIIGPGGGVDVLRAVVSGSPDVTGIEINPIIANTIMRDRYADFAYHLYERPGVDIQVGDGRSFIRNANQTFDVIQMTLVDTWASTAAGAFALSENNLYTSEAFQEYFAHLKPDGMVAITRWEFRQPREALRVASVAMDAMHRIGISETSSHFIVVSQGELDEDGINVAVLAKKSPFTSSEENALKDYVRDHPPLRILYTPSQVGTNAFSRLIQSNDPVAFSRDYPFNVSPVDDNQPFFFFTLKTGSILQSASDNGAMDWKVNLGVAVLGMLLLISVAAVLAFLLFPLLLGGKGSGHPSSLMYFVAVGLGYILVEVSFIQRFVLFLGHPTYALTVVVFLMLLSSGAGSFASRKWFSQTHRVWIPLAAIVVALIAYASTLPHLLNELVGLAFDAKLLVSAAVLVPLGFAMGMPFPTGLRAVCESAASRSEANTVEWAWAMNAAASVLGSVLAIVIAMQFGLKVTLLCGAAAYALAVVAKPRPARAGGVA